jgi:hypothetical protein
MKIPFLLQPKKIKKRGSGRSQSLRRGDNRKKGKSNFIFTTRMKIVVSVLSGIAFILTFMLIGFCSLLLVSHPKKNPSEPQQLSQQTNGLARK